MSKASDRLPPVATGCLYALMPLGCLFFPFSLWVVAIDIANASVHGPGIHRVADAKACTRRMLVGNGFASVLFGGAVWIPALVVERSSDGFVLAAWFGGLNTSVIASAYAFHLATRKRPISISVSNTENGASYAFGFYTPGPDSMIVEIGRRNAVDSSPLVLASFTESVHPYVLLERATPDELDFVFCASKRLLSDLGAGTSRARWIRARAEFRDGAPPNLRYLDTMTGAFLPGDSDSLKAASDALRSRFQVDGEPNRMWLVGMYDPVSGWGDETSASDSKGNDPRNDPQEAG